MTTFQRLERSQAGAALMMVLAAIVLISLAMVGVVELASHTADESLEAAKRFKARQIAESGIALGQHPDIEATDSVLRQELEGGYRLDVTVTSEQGRIFINSASEDSTTAALYDLFVVWGLSADEATIASESLADWIDTDDDARSRGAENQYYAGLGYEQFPRNVAFTSLEELLLVRGFDAVAKAKPDWRDVFTLYGDGEIDVNAASADVIHAFAGVPITNAERFVQTRNGPDEILGTPDDTIYVSDNVQDAVAVLGIPAERTQELGQLFTLEGSAVRIESKATVGDLEYTLVVISDRASGSSLVREWK